MKLRIENCLLGINCIEQLALVLPSSTINTLGIVQCGVNDDGARALARILNRSLICHIDIQNNVITSDGAVTLLEAAYGQKTSPTSTFQGNQTICRIEFSGNPLGSRGVCSCANYWSSMVLETLDEKNIFRLNNVWCGPQGIESLVSVMECVLDPKQINKDKLDNQNANSSRQDICGVNLPTGTKFSIELDGNPLGSSGSSYLQKLLCMPSLTTISLNKCFIGDIGAIDLVKASLESIHTRSASQNNLILLVRLRYNLVTDIFVERVEEYLNHFRAKYSREDKELGNTLTGVLEIDLCGNLLSHRATSHLADIVSQPVCGISLRISLDGQQDSIGQSALNDVQDSINLRDGIELSYNDYIPNSEIRKSLHDGWNLYQQQCIQFQPARRPQSQLWQLYQWLLLLIGPNGVPWMPISNAYFPGCFIVSAFDCNHTEAHFLAHVLEFSPWLQAIEFQQSNFTDEECMKQIFQTFQHHVHLRVVSFNSCTVNEDLFSEIIPLIYKDNLKCLQFVCTQQSDSSQASPSTSPVLASWLSNLPHFCGLQSLLLSNSLLRQTDLNGLFRAFSQLSHLQTIQFDNHPLEQMSQMLNALKDSHVVNLSLRNSGLGPTCGKLLSSLLVTCKTLRVLLLDRNPLAKEGIQQIALALHLLPEESCLSLLSILRVLAPFTAINEVGEAIQQIKSNQSVILIHDRNWFEVRQKVETVFSKSSSMTDFVIYGISPTFAVHTVSVDSSHIKRWNLDIGVQLGDATIGVNNASLPSTAENKLRSFSTLRSPQKSARTKKFVQSVSFSPTKNSSSRTPTHLTKSLTEISSHHDIVEPQIKYGENNLSKSTTPNGRPITDRSKHAGISMPRTYNPSTNPSNEAKNAQRLVKGWPKISDPPLISQNGDQAVIPANFQSPRFASGSDLQDTRNPLFVLEVEYAAGSPPARLWVAKDTDVSLLAAKAAKDYDLNPVQQRKILAMLLATISKISKNKASSQVTESLDPSFHSECVSHGNELVKETSHIVEQSDALFAEQKVDSRNHRTPHTYGSTPKDSIELSPGIHKQGMQLSREEKGNDVELELCDLEASHLSEFATKGSKLSIESLKVSQCGGNGQPHLTQTVALTAELSQIDRSLKELEERRSQTLQKLREEKMREARNKVIIQSAKKDSNWVDGALWDPEKEFDESNSVSVEAVSLLKQMVWNPVDKQDRQSFQEIIKSNSVAKIDMLRVSVLFIVTFYELFCFVSFSLFRLLNAIV